MCASSVSKVFPRVRMSPDPTRAGKVFPRRGTSIIWDRWADGASGTGIEEKVHYPISNAQRRTQKLLRTSLFNHARSAVAADRAVMKARTERSISFGVVVQSQTLTRITAFPRQLEPPHQHSPDR